MYTVATCICTCGLINSYKQAFRYFDMHVNSLASCSTCTCVQCTCTIPCTYMYSTAQTTICVINFQSYTVCMSCVVIISCYNPFFQAFAQLLSTNTTLIVLNLESNRIGREGIKASFPAPYMYTYAQYLLYGTCIYSMDCSLT